MTFILKLILKIPEGKWFSHFEQLHNKHQLSNEQENILKKLHNDEMLRNSLNELDAEIKVEIVKTAKQIK